MRFNDGFLAGGFIGLALTLSMAGCATSSGPSMDHEITVPREHRAGRGWWGAPSDIERYVEAYERGWWACIENFAADIRYESAPEDLRASGWGSEVDGYHNGYSDAEQRIRRNIRSHGPEATREYLLTILEGK